LGGRGKLGKGTKIPFGLKGLVTFGGRKVPNFIRGKEGWVGRPSGKLNLIFNSRKFGRPFHYYWGLTNLRKEFRGEERFQGKHFGVEGFVRNFRPFLTT